MYTYRTEGVCSRVINIEMDGDTVKEVDFEGGCNGNLKAISRLISGKTVDEVAGILEGMTCGSRLTSCPDQLVKGLREASEASQNS
ncbi:MAG: TIGR03905 family TSCPD domain-containing protein [Eggerthellaceae bacterium]|nr:TIGR03905 family TSCPD domain-containing protein [Eggerthellaceae bacterium]MDR2715324.1 TIGR03905 family TSCPD domain-containing protein [Coriobacteriaceae bacterium]